MPDEDGEADGPRTLDYFHRAARREPSWARWFWSGLWSEFRSELQEVPRWMVILFGALLLLLVVGLINVMWAVATLDL